MSMCTYSRVGGEEVKSVSAVISVCGPKHFPNRFGIFKKSFKRMPKLLEIFTRTALTSSLWNKKEGKKQSELTSATAHQ